MVDPARVLVDPDIVSEDDLRRMLAPHSLETVRWVVVSTKQTLDDLVDRDLFNNLGIYDGLNVYSALEQLGAEAREARQTAQTLQTDVENTIKSQSPAYAPAVPTPADAPAGHDVSEAQASLKQRAASLVHRTGSLVRRTDRALRDAGREAIERARHQTVRIVHDLADAGSYALNLASSRRARQAMRVIVAVVAVGALGVQFIPVLQGIKDAVGQSDVVVSALAAVQALLRDDGRSDEREKQNEPEAFAPVPAPPGALHLSFVDAIERLARQHTGGALTDEEFTQFKQKVLESEPCP